MLQFLPSTDGKLVTCLWESDSVDDVQSYVDETLGDASVNLCYAVEETAAFAERRRTRRRRLLSQPDDDGWPALASPAEQ